MLSPKPLMIRQYAPIVSETQAFSMHLLEARRTDAARPVRTERSDLSIVIGTTDSENVELPGIERYVKPLILNFRAISNVRPVGPKIFEIPVSAGEIGPGCVNAALRSFL